jgi:TatD DNase family protein
VDSHAHLDLDGLRGQCAEVVRRAEAAGVAWIGNVFLTPGAYHSNRHLFASMDQVFFVLGVHPHESDQVNADILSSLEKALTSDRRIKALGEIGLDFFRDWCPQVDQVRAFQDQLALARELELPVVIHSRAAEQRTLEILTEMSFQDRPLLWHCFGGDRDLAEKVLDFGWTISIPGTVTFKRNTSLQEAVQMIPLERMVLETDCPFLAPEPYRGKRNEPALTVFTARKVAELKGLAPESVWARTGDTARRFFSL